MKIGFLGVLGIAFIVLKLIGTISWSWWLVLMPIYLPLALAAVFMAWAMALTDWEFWR